MTRLSSSPLDEEHPRAVLLGHQRTSIPRWATMVISLSVNATARVPGFTASSMYPRVWAASGIDFAELVDTLVDVALKRGTGLR